MQFEEAFARLIAHEGGFVDHPDDPGGATRFGVTERVARAHGYRGSMRDLPITEARRIYRVLYWDAIKADQLPAAVRFHVFDAAVNSGVSQAAKWLQRAVGVRDDGVIGPATLSAVNTFHGSALAARFTGTRLQFMTDLPTWSTFGRGWARRIADNLRTIT